MNHIKSLLTGIILALIVAPIHLFPQQSTDATIMGHIFSQGEYLPYVSLMIEGTTIGTTTDAAGHYRLSNLPAGQYTVITQALGYRSKSINIQTQAGKTIEQKIELEPDIIGLEEVVVTGDRNLRSRQESTTIVNTLTPKFLKSTQTITLSEGLNFVSGLRMENNCQNCGFSQVRINGLEGPYSQILINSRPVFSGLAGVYGLEMIPANMIERVEVVRGGGSALYGSNAIAGTINLILKDPINNVYEVGINTGLTGTGLNNSGAPAKDFSINGNTSLVSPNNKTGVAMYGFFRKRKPFDANNDGFSELAEIHNTTFGGRVFHRPGSRSKIMADFFTIYDDRRGGNNFDAPEHEADIAESVKHQIISGALTYEQFTRNKDLLSIFTSGQLVNRDAYYGAEQSLKDYGVTSSLSYNTGIQYTAHAGNSEIMAGIETRGESLKDQKSGYPDFENAIIENGKIVEIPHVPAIQIADQISMTTGAYLQYEYRLLKWQFSAGARYEKYRIKDLEENGGEKSGGVFNPRTTIKFDATGNLQFRFSYARGYRAPQIFDEDLHIETSGSRQVIHRNDPNLKQETSQSLMSSVDYSIKFNGSQIKFLAEGFYTVLNDPFVNEFGSPDTSGVVIYTRKNAAQGAAVKGINLEIDFALEKAFTAYGGITFQTSRYEQSQEFGEQAFFRAPNSYGFIMLDWSPSGKFGLSATTNYTGSMLVPYFGIDHPDGELRTSKTFFDAGLKARVNIKFNDAALQLFAGVKNIFNSYQDDFDSGIGRDPGYIYGPMGPRTVYAGLKLGNFIK